jgi:hypothetical protein
VIIRLIWKILFKPRRRLIDIFLGCHYRLFADEKTIDAVVRNLEVIGEAVRNIPADI